MNYENHQQQYSFSHGLANAPQLHLQQRQLQQQQQLFQQQYGQSVSSPNVYHLQFTGGGAAGGNSLLQQDETAAMGMPGSLQAGGFTQPGLVPQPFVKHGVPMNMDGSSIHVVSGLDGMIYPHQKSGLKIIQTPDGRLVQQQEGNALGMQQAIIGVDVVGNSGFVDQGIQSVDTQGQGQGMRGNVYTYTKHIHNWVQPQQVTATASGNQGASAGQSSLPSICHLWSQFQQQKQVGIIQQQQQQQQAQHVGQYPQQHQFPNHFHQQPLPSPQQFAASPNLQTIPGLQMIKMQQPPQQKPIPAAPMQLSGLPPAPDQPLQITCQQQSMPFISPSATFSPSAAVNCPSASSPLSTTNSLSLPLPSSLEQQSPTTLTFAHSGPPKVTVTLDSLTHCETFPKQFPNKSESASFSSPVESLHPVKTSSVGKEGPPLNSYSASNKSSQQRQQAGSKSNKTTTTKSPLTHASSSGRSMERFSSESSSFSSPPYTLTPPNSIESSSLSPVVTQFSKSMPDQGQRKALRSSTSSLSSSSSSSSSPPPTPNSSCTPVLSHAKGSQPLSKTITSAASSLVVEVTTSSPSPVTATTTIALSSHSMSTTPTFVMSTTPSAKEISVTTATPQPATGPAEGKANAKKSVVNKSVKTHESKDDSRRVKIPFSWQRKLDDGRIIYLSPSGVQLRSVEQVCVYLLSDATCKCGLECPIQVEKLFCFDPEVGNQPWSSASCGDEDLGGLCNHRREILAMAAFHNSCAEVVESSELTESMGKKRDRKKSVSSLDGLIVTPPKKLKTSITKAVNKHAMSLNSNAQTMNHLVDSASEAKSPSFPKEPPVVFTPQPPVSPANSHSTHGSSCPSSDLMEETGQLTWQPAFPTGPQFDMETDACDSAPLMMQSGHPQAFPTAAAGADAGKQQFPLRCANNRFFSQAPMSGTGKPSLPYMSIDSSDLQYHHKNPGDGTQPLPLPGQHLAAPAAASPHVFYPQTMYPMNQTVAPQQQAAPGSFQHVPWPSNAPVSPASSPHYHAGPGFFQHPSHSGLPQTNAFPKHSTPHQLTSTSWVDASKSKSKRPKSKKDKQKLNSIVDRSSPCTKSSSSKKTAKSALIPSTTVSFFENPTVFVEQQTAIINNSIALCQMSCSTPNPLQTDEDKAEEGASENDTLLPDTVAAGLQGTTRKGNLIEETSKSDSLDKDEDDVKTGTDLESNKSFSDTTENNDSAYLSQTGSDQEKSDTVDGSDSSLGECKLKSEIYDFPTDVVKCETDTDDATNVIHLSTKVEESVPSSVITKSAPTQAPAATSKPSVQKKDIKPTDKKVPARSKHKAKSPAPKKEIALISQNNSRDNAKDSVSNSWTSSSLNGDLSQLLASNNWNIASVQQVLAQYGTKDPGQLNSAVQQVLSQASSAGVEFPASNLLSAAARAQNSQTQGGDQQQQFLSPLQTTSKPVTAPVATSQGKCEASQAGKSSTAVESAVATGVPGNTTAAAAAGVTVVTCVGSQQSAVPQVGASPTLIGNMMQFQQVAAPANLTMNMVLAASGQGQQVYTSESLQSVVQGLGDQEMKQQTQQPMHPLVAQGIVASGAQQPPQDMVSRVKFSVAPVLSSSLGPNVASCNPQGESPVFVNNFGPRMIMNAPMPPVSVSVVTNVTKSLTQVVPALGINQAVFGPQHLVNTHTGTPQLINAATVAQGTHVINPANPNTELISNAAPQSTSLLNPGPQGAHLVNNPTQGSQIMNTLPVQGLSNQLLITNPIHQMSPSNSLSQLSPAVAAQILAQGGQQIQQVSPSFMPSQMQKPSPPTSLLNNQNIFASVSLPTLTVTSSAQDCLSNVVSQSGLLGLKQDPCIGDISKSLHGADKPEAAGLGRTKDVSVSASGGSVYAASSQPVFVIPPGNATTMMQVLGSSTGQLTPASSLSTDLGTQASLQQLFKQSPNDPAQIQNLINSGFNPLALQQVMNTVNLSSVQQHQQQQQQQQQQLQMLQLQQLMLQQFQGQGQNIQGISLPLHQSPNPNPAPTLGTAAIMNAVVPQQSLQLNPVMDMNALQQSLSPVAQGYQNQLSPAAAAQLQHITTALTVQPVAPLTTGSVSLIANTSVPGLQVQQGPAAKNLVSAVPAAMAGQPPPQQTSGQVIATNPTQTLTPIAQATQDSFPSSHSTPVHAPQPPPPPPTPSQQQQPPPPQPPSSSVSSNKSPVCLPDTGTPKTATATSTGKAPSKSKSKSKKCESKKSDPECERNEEDIMTAVNQILAQAVQQQKELNMAAKNQPPPPPKSKSKRSSQSRAKASQALKDLELGKLPSISDGVVLGAPELGVRERTSSLGGVAVSTATVAAENVVGVSGSQVMSGSVHTETKQSANASVTVRHSASTVPVTVSVSVVQNSGAKLPTPAPPALTPASSSFVEQTLNETTNLVSGSPAGGKKTISLKDHLSSIISKDKEGSKRRAAQDGAGQRQGKEKGKAGVDAKTKATTIPATARNGNV